MSDVFEQIIQGKLPCDKVFENDHLIAFHDISPQAPVHILIVPKKKVKGIQDLEPQDYSILSQVVKVAQQLASQFEIEGGYRLLTNNGSDAGQTVFHLHFHLIGGKHLTHELA